MQYIRPRYSSLLLRYRTMMVLAGKQYHGDKAPGYKHGSMKLTLQQNILLLSASGVSSRQLYKKLKLPNLYRQLRVSF